MSSSTAAGGRARERDRIRVLFIMIQMAMGGAERLVLNLIKNLDREVFEPSLAWFVQERPLTEFVDLGIPLHYIPKKGGFDWTTISRLSRLVRDHRIEIINAHHFMPVFYAYYGAKVANRSHLIYTEHSENDVLKASGIWKIVGARIVNACDGVIGVSEPVSSQLLRHFSLRPANVHTIENGVDLDLFSTSPQSRARSRAQCGFSPDETVIGIVANFRKNKNHRFLLSAFAEVNRARPKTRLIIVGQGFAGDPESSEEEIAQAIRDARLAARVNVIGYRSDVRDVLQALDVFCLVSHREGLPLSLIEAMACGLPVIGTDVAGIRDVIQPEANGLLVAPDDVPGLVSALTRLVDDAVLRQSLGLASQRIARERYSFRRCIDETQRVFRSVAADRPVDHNTVPARPFEP